jgi:hypothetical protein
MINIIYKIFLYLFTFLSLSLLGFPIIFDFLFTFCILIIFRKENRQTIFFNSSIIIITVFINFGFGANEKYSHFYRAHEKHTTKQKTYKRNINDTIYMPFGDIYVMDAGLDKRREKIKEPRKQIFITDNYGQRNNITDIKEADIIIVGDSFIVGTGVSQEYIPANALSKFSGKKVASLAYGGLEPNHYEELVNEYLKIIKPTAQIYVFYYDGNDFNSEINNKNVEIFDKSKFFYWRGNKIPVISGKIRFAYERLERAKDKFLLKVMSDKNFILRVVRAKSHILIRQFFSKLHNTNSPIKYFTINKQLNGFFFIEPNQFSNNQTSYIFKNKKVLKRINGIFFIPSKARVYSSKIGINILKNYKIEFLEKNYSKNNIPVHDLTNVMTLKASQYLDDDKFLFYKDDTHWNPHGISEAMNFVNLTINR